MASLDLHLRRAVERAAEGLVGPDGHHQAIWAVFRRALARVRAARGLAAHAEDAEHDDPDDPDDPDAKEIDWARVEPDELAAVYEGLLALGPSGERPRKRSGTYYTPPELVARLLDESLEPLLDEACAGRDPAAALLELRVCDPACGSGRFLLAAAERIAARLRALDLREPIASVIERCIYGVDVDPLAIELCRLELELAAGGRARGDRLRCGDALLGAAPGRAASWAEADAWCAAAVWPAHAPESAPESMPDAEAVAALAQAYRFFHWSLAYPEVFAAGGFDLVIGNPPWEVLERHDERSARRAGARRLIAESGRFPAAAAARKNLYALFAELGDALIHARGRLGLIVPTELVQGAIAERLARPWFEQRRCAAVFDFQNRPASAPPGARKWFADVHPQLRFSLVCLAPDSAAPRLCSNAKDIAETRDPSRVYRHEAAAILKLCRGSFRLPLVDGPADRRIHERAYARGRPLAELLAEPGVAAGLLFNFAAADKRAKLDHPAPGYLRVYEGEHIHQFNHRYATHVAGRAVRVEPARLRDREFAITTASYLPTELVHARLRALARAPTLPEFVLVLRRQARAADAHVGIATIIPTAAVEGSLTCVLARSGPEAAILCACFNSFAFNYLLAGRQTGPNVNKGLLAELPILDRRIAAHPRFDPPWFAARVVELCWTATELEPFARACGHAGPAFAWTGPRRAALRCELEAAIFHLYGFDPEAAARALDGFAIVARRERGRWGEYRSKRGILAQLERIHRATIDCDED